MTRSGEAKMGLHSGELAYLTPAGYWIRLRDVGHNYWRWSTNDKAFWDQHLEATDGFGSRNRVETLNSMIQLAKVLGLKQVTDNDA